jgi:hypothetical protein
MKQLMVLILVFSFFSETTLASDFIKHLAKNESSPKANIHQVSWIAGHWKGEAFGGLTEEIWSPPQDKSMMCVFRLSKDGDVSFYEIEVIREINNSLILELKHFTNELKGWEEKNQVVAFPLVEITSNAAYFDGLSFIRISENEMHVYVDVETDGKTSEVLFSYKRAK